MKPQQVNLPYPSLDDISYDPRSAMIVSPAYAGGKSELNAIMQYVYHSIQFGNQGYTEYSDLMINISEAEMHHLDILGNMLYRLGVDPIYTARPPIRNNFYSTHNVDYVSTPLGMLEADLRGEQQAIIEYNDILARLDNQAVATVISRIIKDEELHVELLTNAINELKGK